MARQKLLLSACCGPCTTVALEQLCNKYDVTVFFYGDNLSNESEYNKRLDALKTVNKKLNDNKEMIIVPYVYKDLGLADEPEGGARCKLCFYRRLASTAEAAKSSGFDTFATTLTNGPHKNAEIINELGKVIAKDFNLLYLSTDFKKDGGFMRSVELSKQFGIYRQNYCGCEYSLRKK